MYRLNCAHCPSPCGYFISWPGYKAGTVPGFGVMLRRGDAKAVGGGVGGGGMVPASNFGARWWCARVVVVTNFSVGISTRNFTGALIVGFALGFVAHAG